MRVWIFTGTLAIILGVMLVVAELSLREERTVQRAYERFCTAVEAAVDDACEYLSLIVADEDLHQYNEAKQAALAYVDQNPDPLCF